MPYSSDESGRDEIYVRGFPDNRVKTPVSSAGGRLPRWRQDGKETFYRGADGKLMIVPVGVSTHGLEFGAPAALISTTEPAGIFAYPYDISPDGQRILALVPVADQEGAQSLTVLVN